MIDRDKADVGAGRRLDAFTVFVEPLLRKGADITVCSSSFVTRVVFAGAGPGGRAIPRVSAVEVEGEGPGPPVLIYGAEIVLASGALNTPQILMLSGIGDRDALAAAGVQPVVHSPSVGRHLQVCSLTRLSSRPTAAPDSCDHMRFPFSPFRSYRANILRG